MPEIKKQIVRSWDWEIWNHRKDFQTCPNCDHEMLYTDWDNYATHLVLDTIQGKHGSAVIVSECPKCFEKSWVHQDLRSDIEHISEEWQEALSKELKDRIAIAQREWDLSLCRTCKKIEKTPQIKDTIAYRSCAKGLGPVVKKCDLYKKGKENKMRSI